MEVATGNGCADKRWVCRQGKDLPTGAFNLLLNWELGLPTGDESLQVQVQGTDILGDGCADSRWMCRQDMRAFSIHMNFMLGVPTEYESLQCAYELQAGCADRI